MTTQQFTSEVIAPKSHRVVVYFVEAAELESLRKGGIATTLLSFGLAMFSAALSFIAVLLSTPIQSERTFTVFVVIAVVSTVAGCVLLVIWWLSGSETKRIIEVIKQRFPEGERLEATARYSDNSVATAEIQIEGTGQ